MDIFLKYELYQNDCYKIVFNYEYFEKHPEVFDDLFADEELDVRVHQRYENKKLFDRNDNYSVAVTWIVNDIKDEESILSKLFKDKFLNEDLNEHERRIRIFKYIFPILTLRQFAYKTLPGARYALTYFQDHSFKFFLPKEFLEARFGEKYDTIDIKKLTNDEIIEYILPDYYLSLSYADLKKPKDKEDPLANLGREWLNEDNQVVSVVK